MNLSQIGKGLLMKLVKAYFFLHACPTPLKLIDHPKEILIILYLRAGILIIIMIYTLGIWRWVAAKAPAGSISDLQRMMQPPLAGKKPQAAAETPFGCLLEPQKLQ